MPGNRISAAALGLVVLLAGGGGGQTDGGFIADLGAPYGSFGEERYIRYFEGFAGRRAMYDRLGQFMSFGAYGVRWNETRDRYTDDKVAAGLPLGSLRAQSDLLQQLSYFGFLAITRQNYGSQFMALTVGRNISTTFSPLVLNQLQYGGLRGDYHAPGHDLTFLLSRGGKFGSARFSDFAGNLQGVSELSPVLVYGARYGGRFGALHVGLQGYRQVQSNVKSRPGSLWEGDIPYPELRSPHQLRVRVTDDAPRQGRGTAVRAAHILVRGLRDSVAVILTSDPARAGDGVSFDPGLAPLVQGRQSGGRWVAQGPDEAIDIAFSLPEGLVATQATVEVVARGDYRIAVRQLHDFALPGGGLVERSWPSRPPVIGTSRVYFKDTPYQAEPYYTVVRAQGAPSLDSPERVVRFHHAIPTAQGVYSASVDLNSRLASASGELAYNPQHFQFPVRGGAQAERRALAGFLTGSLVVGQTGRLGGEVFSISPAYGGWYDSRRGGLILFTDVAGDVRAGAQLGQEAVTQEFEVFDDNDDHDPWPDDRPFSGDALYVPQGAFVRPVFPASRPEGGVYPGYDLNGDLVLDFDRNRNAVMDWVEPFLGHDAEPPEFAYGTDFNNNLVPDFRENDDEPDYPYRRDQRGVHAFCDLPGLPWWLQGRTGWYRIRQQAGGEESRGFYARLASDLEGAGYWVRLRDDAKRVRDAIPDDLYRIVLTADPAVSQRYNEPTRPPVPDFLPMRNSLVNTAFVEVGWLPAAGVQTNHAVRYLVNHRLRERAADGSVGQPAETLHNLSVSNRIGWRAELLPQLALTLRGRHLLALWEEASFTPVDSTQVGQEAAWSLFAPEVVLSRRLTPDTRVELGQHGFFWAPLRARYHDWRDEDNDYTENVSVLQVTMQGQYGGYALVASLGVRRQEREAGASALAGDVDLTAFFLDLIFGVD
ncbi:MAG: hypothetical protein AB1505_12445 [Candidatus Latescibacterota bacterium]